MGILRPVLDAARGTRVYEVLMNSPDKCKHCGKSSAIMLEMDRSWWLCVRCWLQGINTKPERPTSTRTTTKDE